MEHHHCPYAECRAAMPQDSGREEKQPPAASPFQKYTELITVNSPQATSTPRSVTPGSFILLLRYLPKQGGRKKISLLFIYSFRKSKWELFPSCFGETEAQTKQGQVPGSREEFGQKKPTELGFKPQQGSIKTLGSFGTCKPGTVPALFLLPPAQRWPCQRNLA